MQQYNLQKDLEDIDLEDDILHYEQQQEKYFSFIRQRCWTFNKFKKDCKSFAEKWGLDEDYLLGLFNDFAEDSFKGRCQGIEDFLSQLDEFLTKERKEETCVYKVRT